MPANIDILLLSIGEDGHIASLFPNKNSLLEKERNVILVTGDKPPIQRITITQKVITNTRMIFSFVTGEMKGKAFGEAIKQPNNFLEVPARLEFHGTWLMDDSATLSIREHL